MNLSRLKNHLGLFVIGEIKTNEWDISLKKWTDGPENDKIKVEDYVTIY